MRGVGCAYIPLRPNDTEENKHSQEDARKPRQNNYLWKATREKQQNKIGSSDAFQQNHAREARGAGEGNEAVTETEDE